MGYKMYYFYFLTPYYSCLLYTSDAADDTPCVDLGGRRIIKKIFFKQKTAYEIHERLVGSEMCIRDSSYIRYFFFDLKILLDINCCDQNRKEIYFLLELQITKDIQLK